MPIYEYQCQGCQHVFEEWQKSVDCREALCPTCGGKAERLISSTAFVLKGGGWYVTDYSRKAPDTGAKGPLKVDNAALEKMDQTQKSTTAPKSLAEKAISSASTSAPSSS